LTVGPQQAFASSQQAAPSTQHFCTAAQQPLLSAQHFIAASQQPSLASATQHADFSVQQASFFVQQLALAASGLVAQQVIAVVATGFVVPQHASALSQQPEPSVQHF